MTVVGADEGTRSSRLGHVIGNYRLVRVLGEGGVGTVYEVEHVRLGRKKAMKLLHAEVTTELVTRFFNEARAVNEIRHPNIIDIEDFVTLDSGESFMVMELLVGEDLRATINREKILDEARVRVIGEQLAAALAKVHSVGIIHRDLKPENIFLRQKDGKEIPMLLDFGVAKFLDDTTGLTRADISLGTPSYMAPEQIIKGRTVGSCSDIYSLGMVMYECLTGTTAFARQSRANVLRSHCYVAPESPSRRRGHPVGEVLESIVMKCLAKRPEHRFSNATDLEVAFASETPFSVSSYISSPALALLPAEVVAVMPKDHRFTPPAGTATAQPPREPRTPTPLPLPVVTRAPTPIPVPVEIEAGADVLEPPPTASSRRKRVLQLAPAVGIAAIAIVVLAWPGGDQRAPSTVGVVSLGVDAEPADDDARASLGAGCGGGPDCPSGQTCLDGACRLAVDAATPPANRITLVSKPAGAELFRDGKPIGVSPTTIVVPVSTTPVSIVARFPDGREVTQTFVPDRPRPEIAFIAPPATPNTPGGGSAKKPSTTPTTPTGRDETIDPFKK